MSEIAAAASSYEHALRRAQSTGNLLTTESSSRSALATSHLRSDSHLGRGSSVARIVPRPLSPTAMASSPITIPETARSRPQSPPDVPWALPRASTAAQVDIRMQADHRQDDESRSLLYTLLEIVGYSGSNAKARRALLSLIWNLGFSATQFVIIVTLLAYSSHHESPTHPGKSEWSACDRPLGVWDSLWLVRVALGVILSIWSYRRDRATRTIQQQRERERDVEALISPLTGRPMPPNRPPPRTMRPPPNLTNPYETGPPGQPSLPPVVLPNERSYARLSLLCTFMSLAWFLTAHILEYTSVNDCRHSSPHLWWLTFGILCILYLMVLEIFLLGLLVFVLGPVVYLLWNIVLLCFGRHPLQMPHYIKPDIGKLPKAIVDQIPLVLYIPTPDEESAGYDPNSPITIPSPSYSYPPKRTAPGPRPKRRFAFLRKVKLRKNKGNGTSGPDSTSEKDTGSTGKRERANIDPEKAAWEDRWEPGDYPFVRLEGNRAVCAICLMDFEEPKRLGESDEAKKKPEADATAPDSAAGGGVADTPIEEVQVEEVTQEERDRLKLDDAGEGAQPLRLLPCGHVFHQVCVDPWLIDVSGRCPTCQRPVELPDSNGKKKKQAQRTT